MRKRRSGGLLQPCRQHFRLHTGQAQVTLASVEIDVCHSNSPKRYWSMDRMLGCVAISVLLVEAFGRQFSFSSGDVAVDGAGKVYVADFNNHRIQVFDANGCCWCWASALHPSETRSGLRQRSEARGRRKTDDRPRFCR